MPHPPSVGTHNLLPFSGDSDTAVLIEIIAQPVPVRVPTLTVLIAIRDVAVAIVVHHDRTKSHLYHRPLTTLGVESYSGCRKYLILQLLAPSSNKY